MPKFQRWRGIMKCYPFEEKRLSKWRPPYIVQIKYDGDRCRNIPLEKCSLLVSSEENIRYSTPHINDQLDSSGAYKIPWDGEHYNHKLFLEGGHELIHSIASRTVNLHPRYKELDFIIFDVQYPDKSQAERLKFISSQTNLPNVKIAPFWICNNLSEIKQIYDKVLRENYEGIIIRNLYTPYEDKRSTQIMKFKPKKKDKYKIVGWKEELTMKGEPKGRIGSLIMSSQVGDEFGVSAGLDFDEKDRLWKTRDTLIGKMAVVHYQHLTNKKIPKGTFNVEVIEDKF